MKEKVVVTGGAGFIGSHLTKKLIDMGYEVHVIDSLIAGKKENIPTEAILHIVDIRDQEKLTPIFQGSLCVFHLAALPSVPYSIEYPVETHEVNALGTLKVLVSARDAHVRRVVYSSSSAVYGNQDNLPIFEDAICKPNTPYGLQKLEGEYYMRLINELYGVETISLRYFNLYGPRQNASGPYASVVAKFLDQSIKGEVLTIFGEGLQTRDFVHVEDVVEANILAMRTKGVGKGEVVNIGGGAPHTITELAEIIGGKITYLPPRIEIQNSYASIARAQRILGWIPKKTFNESIVDLKYGKEL